MNQRVLGLDVGEKRIGIAVSDLLGITAQPLETYHTVGYGPDVRHISALCSTWDTSTIVVGLPRNMDGSEGAQAAAVRAFAGQLESTGFTVLFWDERLTTQSAHKALIQSGMRRENRKHVVDQAAAVLILQGFIDAGGLQKLRASDRVKKPDLEE